MDPIAPPDRRRPPTGGDVALAGGLLVVALLSGLFVDAARPDTIEPATWWHWLLICAPPVLVAVRRLDPVAVTGLATVAQAAIWISNLPEVLLPVIVILYTSASEAGTRGRRAAIASSMVLAAVTAVGVAIADDVTAYQLPLVALTCGTAIALGVMAANQRTEAGTLAATVAETKLLAEHERGQAISDERAYIGRELHDSIGHSLSVIAVRAEAADRVADHQPEAAREAVADIAAAARSALAETRRVLAGLQRSSAAELDPPRDLAATFRLIDDLVATGADLSLTSEGCDHCQPSPMVAGGLYRIVQESLTNAIKHGGPGVRIDVAVRCGPVTLEVVVTSAATTLTGSPGGGSIAAGSTGTWSGEPTDRNGGRRDDVVGSGLIGLAERAKVLGGNLVAEPRADGGFVVRGSLPMVIDAGAAEEADR